MTETSSSPLPPGSTIGIVGSGQLGRMLASAAAKLGFRVHVLGPDAAPPARDVAGAYTQAPYDDEAALRAFAETVDVATYEFENIPVQTVTVLKEAGLAVRPDERVLSVCQDRWAEKKFLVEQGVQTAPTVAIASVAELSAALADLGGPGILKTRRFGYDGKGQVRIKPGDDLEAAYKAVGDVPCVLEGMVAFDAELSQITARGPSGEIAFFDPARNSHRDGVLRKSHVPSGLPEAALAEARAVTTRAMEALDFVGVMAIEFFWSADGGLIANEIAPRVHNSGHWTVEACRTSQFEQHIRAVAGWPLGDASLLAPAEMHNLLGTDVDAWQELAATPGVSLTLYGKREARPGRKMGHWVRLRR